MAKYGCAACAVSASDQNIGFVLRVNGSGLMRRTYLTGLCTSANTAGPGNLMSFFGAVGASFCGNLILAPRTLTLGASTSTDG